MHPLFHILFLVLLSFLPSVRAELYVIQPQPSTTCHAGKNCSVEWLDNGQKPLLTSIGICTVGLYYGKMKLVQQITPVDASSVISLEFVPNPLAGPNDMYYIAFQSTTYKVNDSLYISWSPPFSIDGMTGSFASSNSSLTSPIPVPPSVLKHSANSITSTITVGTLYPSTSASSSSLLSTSSPSPSVSASGSTLLRPPPFLPFVMLAFPIVIVIVYS